jgi:hypothetical protein
LAREMWKRSNSMVTREAMGLVRAIVALSFPVYL